MSAIRHVIVTCHAKDLWLARICVASIRYWYPDVRIGLLKDTSRPDFDSTEIETAWNVERLQPTRNFGRYFTKLGAFFLPEKEKFFLVDSDTVFAGPLLDYLGSYHEDFIVEWPFDNLLSETERNNFSSKDYLDVRKVRELYPGYEPPGFFFNSGQIVVTPGILCWEDFAPLLDDANPSRARHPGLFSFDQGILNFALARKIQTGSCSVRPLHFMKWPPNPGSTNVDLKKIRRREGYPLLFHWAGFKPYYKAAMRYNDLLAFFEHYYYSRIRHGTSRKLVRLWQRHQQAQRHHTHLRAPDSLLLRPFPRILWQELRPRREAYNIPSA